MQHIPNHYLRLIKEGMLLLADTLPGMLPKGADGYKWYLSIPGEGDRKAVVNCVLAMQKRDYIPWPNTKCVILVPRTDGDRHELRMIFRNPAFDDPRCAGKFDSFQALCVQSHGDRIYKYAHNVIVGRAVRNGTPWGQPGVDDLDCELVPDNGPCWFGCNVDWNKPGDWNRKNAFWYPGPALPLLVALANMVAPCGYTTKTKMLGTFGNKSQRRKIAGSEIICQIPMRRQYRVAGEGDGCPLEEGYDRDAYVYHCWKEAGLNRLDLPKCPIERLILAEENNVRTFLVPAHWVGPKAFEHSDYIAEIVTEKLSYDWFTVQPSKKGMTSGI